MNDAGIRPPRPSVRMVPVADRVGPGVGSGVGARLAAGSGSITAKSLTADTEAGTPAPCMALAISSTCDFFLFFYRMILRSELHTGVGTRAYSRRKLFLFSTDDAELCEGWRGELRC